MKTCIASSCLWAVAILKSLLCLSARFSWLFNIWTRSCSRFFCYWQLAPAGLLCDLVTVDADWRRLNLLTDSRRTTQIWNWLRQLQHHTQVIHCLQTVHCWLPLMCQRWENSWILISWWHHAQEMLATRFQETTQSEQHWHFQCRHLRLYLSQTQNYQRMHISFEYALKMGAEGMFCSSKLQVK